MSERVRESVRAQDRERNDALLKLGQLHFQWFTLRIRESVSRREGGWFVCLFLRGAGEGQQFPVKKFTLTEFGLSHSCMRQGIRPVMGRPQSHCSAARSPSFCLAKSVAV